MTQPTALFLADVIDADADAESHHAAAAGELRRLHAQRDALLMALKEIAEDYADRFDLDSPSTNPGIKFTIEQARAAIAKAEGENA